MMKKKGYRFGYSKANRTLATIINACKNEKVLLHINGMEYKQIILGKINQGKSEKGSEHPYKV